MHSGISLQILRRTSWSTEGCWGNIWNLFKLVIACRSSCPESSCKKSVLKNFAKFAARHLCQGQFFIALQVEPATLLKNRIWHGCFPVNFAKLFRIPPFSIELLWWLLLCVPMFFFTVMLFTVQHHLKHFQFFLVSFNSLLEY